VILREAVLGSLCHIYRGTPAITVMAIVGTTATSVMAVVRMMAIYVMAKVGMIGTTVMGVNVPL